MARNITISDVAENDLLEIGRFSKKRWGTAKRDEYLDSIAECIERLASNPYLGESRDDIRQGLYLWPHISHLIFYRFDDETIRIGRILHKSMDVAARLNDDI